MEKRLFFNDSIGWFVAILLCVTAPLCAQSGQAVKPYKMAGPYEVIARDGQYARTKGGSERDMRTALDSAEAHPDLSLRIINAYADKLQRMDGHDAPLCLIQCYDLLQAMTLLREHKTEAWDKMVRRAMLPTMEQFEDASPYANGNWGAIVNRARMACGIYLQDTAIYQASIDYYLNAYDNGALQHYVGADGQCQETGRDQAHAQLGLEALAQTCEMAWQQGDDLWGALDNRLMKGFEYTARYNLGYDVPFQTWQDCTGLYCEWTVPGAMSRGKLWDIYELPYKHYHGRLGLPMPYTAKAIKALKSPKTMQKLQALDSPRLHQVFTYPAPKGAPLNNTYKVRVKARGNQWIDIDTYEAKANVGIGDNKHKVCSYSYGYFDFTGVVDVEVVTSKPYQTVRVRPDYRGVIANHVNDTTLRFVLFQPEHVSVEFDGDITNNLLLFTSHPIADGDRLRAEAGKQLQWQEDGRNCYSFGHGFYHLDDTLRLPSHSTLYLADGAYIDGIVNIEGVEDVRVVGRGVIRPSRNSAGVYISRSRNVLAQGFVTTQCPVGGCRDVRVEDVKSLTHYGWGDGLNVFASSNVSYHRVFCRNSDDCTTVYATRKGYTGSSSNITMTNSTLWADVAHPIFIGLHGSAALNPELPNDSCTNLRYDNIDILCQSEPQIDYQGCMAINSGDNNLVKDVEFSNIRIESLHQGSLVNMRVCYNPKYCAAPGRNIENVRFNLIRYNGAQPEYSIITGYNEQRKVSGVHFKDLRINGRHIHDKMPGKPGWYRTWDMMRCFVGNHVEDVTFE